MGIGPGESPTTEDVAAFADQYRNTDLQNGAMTLGAALDYEAVLCPADPEKRDDPERRLRWMASQLGHNALVEEHQHLLDSTTE